MTATELEAFKEQARGLFPSATSEQIALILDSAKDRPFQRMIDLLKSHAKQHTWLTPPAFMEGMRAEWASQQRTPQIARERDLDAIYARYADCWAKVKNDPTSSEVGKAYVRAEIYRDTIQSAKGAGASQTDAILMAESACELPSGSMPGPATVLKGTP